jgi:signal transduction histidine kinase
MSDPSTPEPTTTILAVDDNATNRQLVQAMLKTGGYETMLAQNGTEGLALFEKHRPDLVLLDIRMPGVDGFEVCKRIRAHPEGQKSRIMLITALTDFASVQSAIDLGADDFLAKPINRLELLARVRWLLHGRGRPVEARAESEPARAPEPELERERQRGLLSAMAVHDLKHPLSTIYFSAGMLRRDASLSAKARERLDRILAASEALDAMLAGMLDIGSSEDGTLTIHPSEFAVASLLDDVLAAMGPRAELNGHRIELVVQGLTRPVKADRDMLRRVLQNLVDNSTKYAPPKSAIRLEARDKGSLLEFRVRDEGPGIPPEFREKIFEKNTQLDRDSALRGRLSRGLGLVFCRVAANAHGGRVWVEPNAPRGSCFCVELPARA